MLSVSASDIVLPALLAALAAFTISSVLYALKSSKLPYPIPAEEDIQLKLHRAAAEKRGPWEVFDSLTKRYGPIFSFSLRGTPTLVLSTATLGWELLEKRGENYSSRPRLVTAHDILSGGLRGLTSPYNDYWRKWRKIQHLGMNARQSVVYREHQTLEATILLRDITRNIHQYHELIERFASSIVLSISYGRRTSSMNDEVVQYNLQSIRAFRDVISSIPCWPILLWLPRPLQWFRRQHERTFDEDIKFYSALVDSVHDRMTAGTQKDCMTSRALSDGSMQLSKNELAIAVSSPFGAGVHTVRLSTCFMEVAAVLYPEAAKKVQTEFDNVVGRDRMPTFADEAYLPYFSAWIKEVLRRWPVAPAAAPHSVSRDDYFEGHRIPKGTTVFANLSTMLKDPAMFSEPEAFIPERFIAEKDDDLSGRLRDFTLPFGFGRRQCPGIHVASQSIFIVMARLLWTFNIIPAKDASAPDPDAYIFLGLTILPKPFKFALEPRFPDALRILEVEASEADARVKEWE
ncbi:cytochrome P450 [Vararia minispora EC-137]|uniref:Cytochrome P450 n=1 Tax=Vararia minispora EC-137 TaxID=1314806 RepID=A0ACB8QH07_9AGAM|nr:cytochrome P450 [Vararia minispora EC-137]